MKTSILMSVYNGRKYILQQLESIRKQTINPDEVIILDDCSSDNTSDIIASFIKENQLEQSWKLYINLQNKGWARNFIEGIELTSGDIIFFSDQDDIWLEEKIEIYRKLFLNNSIDVLISPYIEWNGKALIPPKMNSEYHRIWMNGSFDNFNITGSGCTMAFKRDYYDSVKAYYVEGWAHDDFLRKMSQIDGRLYVLETPGILRRFHGDNVTMKKRTYKSSCNTFEVGMKSIDSMRLYIQNTCDNEVKRKNNNFLVHLKQGYENRLSFFRTGKLSYLLRTFFFNREQYVRKRQILGDFLLVIRELGYVRI